MLRGWARSRPGIVSRALGTDDGGKFPWRFPWNEPNPPGLSSYSELDSVKAGRGELA